MMLVAFRYHIKSRSYILERDIWIIVQCFYSNLQSLDEIWYIHDTFSWQDALLYSERNSGRAALKMNATSNHIQ